MSETPQSKVADTSSLDTKKNRSELDGLIFGLKDHGLTNKMIAAALDVDVHRIYQMISNPPKRGFFIMERIFALKQYCEANGQFDLARRVYDLAAQYFNLQSLAPSYISNFSDFLSPETEELWQFSREPLELRTLEYRNKMKDAIANPELRMVYFTLHNSARRMRHFLASCEPSPQNVVLIGTNAVSLSPDYLIRFQSGIDEGQVATFPDEGENELKYAHKEVAELNDIVARQMRAILETVDLMGFDFRLRKTPSGTYGGGDFPAFEVVDVL